MAGMAVTLTPATHKRRPAMLNYAHACCQQLVTQLRSRLSANDSQPRSRLAANHAYAGPSTMVTSATHAHACKAGCP